jgi:hypothetical protein
MCQTGVMKQILDRTVLLITVAWAISNHPLPWSIIVRTRRDCALSGFFIVKFHTRSTQTMTQGSNSAIFEGKSSYFLTSFWLADRLAMWNIIVQNYCKNSQQIYTDHHTWVIFCVLERRVHSSCVSFLLADRLENQNRNDKHIAWDQATSWCSW